MGKKTKTGKITINSELCKACYLCILVCPRQMIAVSGNLNKKGYHSARFTGSGNENNDKKCTGCATCAVICPDVAIEVYRD